MGLVMAGRETIKLLLISNICMPLITVSMYPGRTQQQKDDYAKQITESAVDILKTKKEHVIVVFDENPKQNWFLAGKQL